MNFKSVEPHFREPWFWKFYESAYKVDKDWGKFCWEKEQEVRKGYPELFDNCLLDGGKVE